MSNGQHMVQQWIVRVDGVDIGYVEPGQSVEIGRKPLRPLADDGMARLEVQDSSRSMSKRHAVFAVQRGGSATICDLNSTNGSYVVRDDGGLMRIPSDTEFLLPNSPTRMQFGDVPVDFIRVEREEEPKLRVPDLFGYAVSENRQEPDAADMSVDDILDLRAGEPTSMFDSSKVRSRAEELGIAQHQTFQPYGLDGAEVPLNVLPLGSQSDQSRDLFADARDALSSQEIPVQDAERDRQSQRDAQEQSDPAVEHRSSIAFAAADAGMTDGMHRTDGVMEPAVRTDDATPVDTQDAAEESARTRDGDEPQGQTQSQSESEPQEATDAGAADDAGTADEATHADVRPDQSERAVEPEAEIPSAGAEIDSESQQEGSGHPDESDSRDSNELKTQTEDGTPVESDGGFDNASGETRSQSVDAEETTHTAGGAAADVAASSADASREPSEPQADTPWRDGQWSDARYRDQPAALSGEREQQDQQEQYVFTPMDNVGKVVQDADAKYRRPQHDDAQGAADEETYAPAFEPGSVFDRVSKGEFAQNEPTVEVDGYTSDEAKRTDDFAVQFEMARHQQLLPFLAMNPSLYDDLYAWLAAQGNRDIDAALARNEGYQEYRKAVGK